MNIDGRNDVHPSAVIGPEVELGRGNVIGAYAVLLGPVRLGDGNWIGPHAVLGGPGEIRGIDHGREIASDMFAAAVASAGDAGSGIVGAGLRIGSGNVIREHAIVHQGHYAVTSVGDGCYLMNRVYIGHDDEIGDGVTMASGVTLGGHVHVGAGANLGMGAIVHQRRVIGAGAMVGMGAVVTADLAPFTLAYGNPARVRGANRVGMGRAGVADDVIASWHQLCLDGRAAAMLEPAPDADPADADPAAAARAAGGAVPGSVGDGGPGSAPAGLPADAVAWWQRETC